MKINLNSYFTKKKNLKPLIVAEISANHNGNKKIFWSPLNQLQRMVLI